MGHVQDRWYKAVKSSETGKVARVKTELYGKGMRYKVRYLDPDGKEVSRSFPDRAKRQADEFLHKVKNEKTGRKLSRPAWRQSQIQGLRGTMAIGPIVQVDNPS
jgi:hypothetical protein